MPGLGRAGALNAMAADDGRQEEIPPQQTPDGAGALRVLDDRVHEPLFLQDLNRLLHVVVLHEVDGPAVDLVRDHPFQHQVSVAAEIHHLPVGERRFCSRMFPAPRPASLFLQDELAPHPAIDFVGMVIQQGQLRELDHPPPVLEGVQHRVVGPVIVVCRAAAALRLPPRWTCRSPASPRRCCGSGGRAASGAPGRRFPAVSGRPAPPAGPVSVSVPFLSWSSQRVNWAASTIGFSLAY